MIRLVLLAIVLLAFLVLQLVPNLLSQAFRAPPATEYVDEVTQFDRQIEGFRNQLRPDEIVNYRVALRPNEEIDTLRISFDIAKAKYSSCPVVLNEKPEAKNLPKRIINTYGQLTFKMIP